MLKAAPGCFVSEQPGEECKGKQEKGWKMDARRNASLQLRRLQNEMQVEIQDDAINCTRVHMIMI